jgi:hypothetical protein
MVLVLIAVRLHQDVDHVAILIHGTPEVLLLAVDSNENLVQVSDIAEAALMPLQFWDGFRTELLTPPPNRFIREDDPTFGQKILNSGSGRTRAVSAGGHIRASGGIVRSARRAVPRK